MGIHYMTKCTCLRLFMVHLASVVELLRRTCLTNVNRCRLNNVLWSLALLDWGISFRLENAAGSSKAISLFYLPWHISCFTLWCLNSVMFTCALAHFKPSRGIKMVLNLRRSDTRRLNEWGLWM